MKLERTRRVKPVAEPVAEPMPKPVEPTVDIIEVPKIRKRRKKQ